MVTRNIKKEELAVGQFQGANKRMPVLEDPNDRAAVYRMAYPPTAGGLPVELKGTVDESLYAGGVTPPEGVANEPAPSLDQLRGTMQQAQAGVEQMSQPNEALRILQEAIRTKSGIAEQPLGTSEVFKEAGLTGMSSLSASLGEQTNKFQSDYSKFSNEISQMRGQYQDMANMALKNYEMAYNQFKDEADRIEAIENQARQHAHALQTIQMQYQGSMDLAKYKDELERGMHGPLPKDPITGAESDPSKIFGSYNFTSYATDPNWGNTIKERYLSQMPEFRSQTDLSNYVKARIPGLEKSSGISVFARDIWEVAKNKDIPVDLLTAIIQHESMLGTSNVAKNNNNPGGITWSAGWGESMKGTPRSTIDPQTGKPEGGYYVKFPTMKDGINAVANNIAKRKMEGFGADTEAFKGLADRYGVTEQQYSYWKNNLEADDTAIERALSIASGIGTPQTTRELESTGGRKVAAVLASMGFDATDATLDFDAMKKRVSSLNSTQQVRLSQSIDAVAGSLNQARQLYTEWERTGYATQYPVTNAAALKAAENLPGEAGVIAKTLKSHITDMVAEIANVYSGGNTSTDKKLEQAALSIGSNWTPEQFWRNIDLIEQNLQIRRNSIKNSVRIEGNIYSDRIDSELDIREVGVIRFESPTGEIKDFKDLTDEQIKDALNKGFKIVP
jgi:hypothetical protein